MEPPEDAAEVPVRGSVPKRTLYLSFLGVVGAFVAYFVVPFDDDRWPIAAVLGLLAVAASVPITIRWVRRIRVADEPFLVAVEAIAVLATLVILTFSVTYYAIATNTDQIPGIHTKLDSLYFTVSTVATVGFGDIVATGQAARGLVTFQIVANLTLLAGAFRLVSAVANERRREQGWTPPSVFDEKAKKPRASKET